MSVSPSGPQAGTLDSWLRATLKAVCETSAPTFAESARADLVEAELRTAGLAPVRDEAGNVIARLPGAVGAADADGAAGTVALVAHLDTVFGAEVDVTVSEGSDGRWRAPGIGDNSASVAILLELGRSAASGLLERRPPTVLAFTVGEEGLGDLRGARRLVEDLGGELAAFLAIDGHLGSVVDAGVGSHRLHACFRGDGGHAWGDYPSPSAVHALGDAVHELSRVPVPDTPRCSLNVAQVGGGTAINAIAAEAWATVDLRSVSATSLDGLRTEVEKCLGSVAHRHGLALELETIGVRPAGRSDDGRLAALASEALARNGLEMRLGASSTDANAAMAAGIPALCLGVYRGGDAHRLGEWIEPDSLWTGYSVLRTLLMLLANEPE